MAQPAPQTTPIERLDCHVVLAAISQITQAESSALIRRRFVESLAQLFPIAGVRFLTPGHAGKLNESLSCEMQPSAQLRWDNQPKRGIHAQGTLARCITSRQHEYQTNNSPIDYFPICLGDYQLLEIIEVRRSTLQKSNRDTLVKILSIYGNFVSVLYRQEIDALTGVHNRGAFDTQIGATAQSLRQDSHGKSQPHWWLIMLDIDHFKRVNDTYGHLIGDEVLLLATRLMVKSLRSIDKVYRYGGEEFAVLVSPCSRQDAISLAHRVRVAIATAHFPQVDHITISAGIAPIDKFDHVANIIGRADKALYQAKRQGRNCVCEYIEKPQGPIGPGLQAPGALELFS